MRGSQQYGFLFDALLPHSIWNQAGTPARQNLIINSFSALEFRFRKKNNQRSIEIHFRAMNFYKILEFQKLPQQ